MSKPPERTQSDLAISPGEQTRRDEMRRRLQAQLGSTASTQQDSSSRPIAQQKKDEENGWEQKYKELKKTLEDTISLHAEERLTEKEMARVEIAGLESKHNEEVTQLKDRIATLEQQKKEKLAEKDTVIKSLQLRNQELETHVQDLLSAGQAHYSTVAKIAKTIGTKGNGKAPGKGGIQRPTRLRYRDFTHISSDRIQLIREKIRCNKKWILRDWGNCRDSYNAIIGMVFNKESGPIREWSAEEKIIGWFSILDESYEAEVSSFIQANGYVLIKELYSIVRMAEEKGDVFRQIIKKGITDGYNSNEWNRVFFDFTGTSGTDDLHDEDDSTSPITNPLQTEMAPPSDNVLSSSGNANSKNTSKKHSEKNQKKTSEKSAHSKSSNHE